MSNSTSNVFKSSGDARLPGVFSCVQNKSPRAGACGVWSLEFAVKDDIASGSVLTLVLVGARDLVDFTCETPVKSLLSVEPAESCGDVTVSRERFDGETALQFSVGLNDDLSPGDTLRLCLGSTDPQTFTAQRYAQRIEVRLFLTSPDSKVLGGEGFEIEVTAGPFDRWVVVAPSHVQEGVESAARIVPLDKYSNRTDDSGQVKARLRRRNAAKADDVELEAAEDGTIGFTPAADEIHEIVVTGSDGREWTSNPILTHSVRSGRQLFWGDIHCKTRFSDGAKSPAECFEYARDTACLDFAAVTDHEAPAGYLSDAQWTSTQDVVNTFNDPPGFVTLLGYEWSGEGKDWFQGHLCVYYRGDTGELYRSSVPEHSTAAQLMRAVMDSDIVVVPHHCAGPLRTHTSEWPVIYNEVEPLVEIYSKWGNYEFHTDPLSRKGGRRKAYVRNALRRGHNMGFVGGSNSHYGMPGGDVYESPTDKYIDRRSGLTAVYARELSRGDIFDALRNRQCYATTGARIVADYTLNGVAAGNTIEMSRDDPRNIHIEAHGTAPIDHIDIIRCGNVVEELPCDSADVVIDWVDKDEMPTILMMQPGGYYLFGFYYVRIVQTDGHIAWLSPVHMACTTD